MKHDISLAVRRFIGENFLFRDDGDAITHDASLLDAGIFGTLLAGGVFSVVNPGTKADKLAYILNHCTAKALITEPRLAEVAAAARARAPAVAATLVTPFTFPDAPAPAEPGIDLDLAMI